MGNSKLIELAKELTEATVGYVNTEKESNRAKATATDAKNRLNKAQAEFDKFVQGIRASAPPDTDWRQPARNEVAASRVFDSYEDNTPHG